MKRAEERARRQRNEALQAFQPHKSDIFQGSDRAITAPLDERSLASAPPASLRLEISRPRAKIDRSAKIRARSHDFVFCKGIALSPKL